MRKNQMKMYLSKSIKGTATKPTNERRAMKHQLGLHGKRKTKYRKAGLTGWGKGE